MGWASIIRTIKSKKWLVCTNKCGTLPKKAAANAILYRSVLGKFSE
jgi:hypothetical protein